MRIGYFSFLFSISLSMPYSFLIISILCLWLNLFQIVFFFSWIVRGVVFLFSWTGRKKKTLKVSKVLCESTLRSEEWRVGDWSVNLTPASWWFIFLMMGLWSPTEDHRDGRGASAPDRVLWGTRAGLCGSVLSKKSGFCHPSPFPCLLSKG